VAHPPKATFVSADSYSVLGKIEFPDADGLEQPAWDSQLHRFLLTVPGSPAYVAVIDPRRMRVTKRFIINRSCNASVNGLTLGPFQRILAVACGTAYIMSAIDGHIISSITQVGGGDEVWYNPGDNRYYVTSADRTANLGQSLGVIDAATSTWLQNVPAPNIRNIAVYAGNNHIFSGVNAPAAGVRDTTSCVAAGWQRLHHGFRPFLTGGSSFGGSHNEHQLFSNSYSVFSSGLVLGFHCRTGPGATKWRSGHE